jgi:hypothetical protein
MNGLHFRVISEDRIAEPRENSVNRSKLVQEFLDGNKTLMI